MGPHAASRPLTLSEQADELEEKMMHDLSERIATRSTLFYLGDGKVEMARGQALLAANPGKHFLMGADPRLPPMPEKLISRRPSSPLTTNGLASAWRKRDFVVPVP